MASGFGPEAARLTAHLRVFGNLSDPNEIQEVAGITPQSYQQLVQRRKMTRQVEEKAAPFGEKIKFNNPLEFRKLLSLDDPMFSKLTPIRQEGDPVTSGAQLVFDLETVEGHRQSLRRSRSPSFGNDVKWLEEKVREFYPDGSPSGMAVHEFCDVLLKTLGSKSDDIQVELFELIGFERLDLIQLVLEHRSDIVASYNKNKRVMRQEIAVAAASIAAEMPQRPNYGCQVVVQSNEEKELKKLARKEEKKLNKLLRNEDQESDFDFNPIELRVKRQAALANAMNTPLFKERTPPSSRQVEQYPFVFDTYADAKSVAGFIQGVKMSLPVGFERKDQRKYEEVSIPAAEKAPVDIGRQLVPISSPRFDRANRF